MNIKPLNIETLFAGIIHLIWITLLTIVLLGKSPEILINYLINVGSGTAVLLFAFTFSLSFFLGRTAENFIIAINYFRKKKNERKTSQELFDGTSGEIWSNKIFSFSSFWALLILGILLGIIINPWDVKWPILLIDFLLLIVTLTSTIYWWKFGKSKLKPNIKKS